MNFAHCPQRRICSADIPVCGFTELSSSVSPAGPANRGLESPYVLTVGSTGDWHGVMT